MLSVELMLKPSLPSSVGPIVNNLGRDRAGARNIEKETDKQGVTWIHHDPDLDVMAEQGAPSATVAVAVPAVVHLTDEDPRPCVYLPTLIKLFIRDQLPAQALCSLLAMCWVWPPCCEAKEKDLFVGSALLSLRQLLKDKLARLAQDVAACLACQRDTKGDKLLVTMGFCLWEFVAILFSWFWLLLEYNLLFFATALIISHCR